MQWVLFLKWVHIIGATVLLGTGAGIAFFMVMAQRTGNVAIIAHTAKTVVIADWIFTASAVIVQPITGLMLAKLIGWPLNESWIVLSLVLYGVTGIFWLPVVWIQHQLWKLADSASKQGVALPKKYFDLYRIWFFCGFPAFISVLAIIWLMTARPQF